MVPLIRVQAAFGRRMTDRLVFHHVPKCGGNAVRSAVAAHYPRWLQCGLKPRPLRGAIELAGLPRKKAREAMLLYVLLEGRYRFVSGHLPFSEVACERFGDRWSFVTVLRHPVDRWFSAYFYRRYRPDHPRKLEEELSSFVDTPPAAKLGRRIVRAFCGDVDEGEDAPAAVARAVENLGKLTLVGTLERLDRFAARFRERFGVELRFARRNPSPRPRERREEEITDEIREKVARLCRPDLEVYESVAGGP